MAKSVLVTETGTADLRQLLKECALFISPHTDPSPLSALEMVQKIADALGPELCQTCGAEVCACAARRKYGAFLQGMRKERGL